MFKSVSLGTLLIKTLQILVNWILFSLAASCADLYSFINCVFEKNVQENGYPVFNRPTNNFTKCNMYYLYGEDEIFNNSFSYQFVNSNIYENKGFCGKVISGQLDLGRFFSIESSEIIPFPFALFLTIVTRE